MFSSGLLNYFFSLERLTTGFISVSFQENIRCRTMFETETGNLASNFDSFPSDEIPVRDTEILSYSPGIRSLKVKPNKVRIPNPNNALMFSPQLCKNQNAGNTSEQVNTSINSGKNTRFSDRSILSSSMKSQEMSRSSGSHTNMSEFLCNLWKNQRMCDMVVHVNGKDLLIHKIALAAHSDKFASLYYERLPTTMSEINLSSATAAAADEIIRFIYTSEISINPQNVDSLIACSKQLGITEIFNRCKTYLLNFNHDNVFSFLAIAEKHEIDEVASQMEFFIGEQFRNIRKSPMFLGQDIEHIKYMLNKDNLRVEKELEIFFAALSWIDHNRQQRMRHAAELMGCVRFVYISPEDLVTDVEPESHIFAIPECKSMLYNAFRYLSLYFSGSPASSSIRIPNRRRYSGVCNISANNINNGTQNYLIGVPTLPVPASFTSTSASNATTSATGLHSSTCAPSSPVKNVAPTITTVQRSPNRTSFTYNNQGYIQSNQLGHSRMANPTTQETMIMIGGVNPFSIESDASCRFVEQYNPASNTWHTLASLPVPRHHLGAGFLDGCLYVVGGSVLNPDDPGNLANPTDVCFRFDPVGKYWTRIASLKKARMYLGLATLEGVLYAVGGSDAYGRSLASVEYYNPDTDTWGLIEPMTEAKIGPAAIGFHGYVYVIGGYNEKQNTKFVLDMMECYDPRTNEWTRKNSLPVPCCHANLVEINGVIYLVGGSTIISGNASVSSLSTIFRYIEDEDRWELFENMSIPRHDAGATVLGSKIYIVGGVSSLEGSTLQDVECLDVETRTWIEGVYPITNPAIGLTCCAFPGDGSV